jgi:hypothetical protein
MLGLLEREITNARRAANLSPEKEARLVADQAGFHVFWYGDTGEMKFVQKTPTHVIFWDVPSEETDRLLNLECWIPSYETKTEDLWLDITSWFGKLFGTESYREREWEFKDELLNGEDLAELRGVIANLEREAQTA